MKKISRKNLQAIQEIVQDRTGAGILPKRTRTGYPVRKMALSVSCLLCFVALCAFAYGKFSDLNGDKAGFAAVYQGDGRFEIIIVNDSDQELELQDKVKVMQWSTSQEVAGDSAGIKMEGSAIAPHSQGILTIDISEGYDIAAMEENLPDGDGYYFVLTNNDFAFGQDWMCFFDFEVEQTAEVADRLAQQAQTRAEEDNAAEPRYDVGELIYPHWVWPTVSRDVSGLYGRQENGTDSDHINIAGTAGDEIYAVADGVVLEAGYESASGNFIVLDLGDGVTAKYGHLKESKVAEGQEVKQGQTIATLGQSGMATGPNLRFSIEVNGEKTDPLAAR